jgi:hypothetical protein
LSLVDTVQTVGVLEVTLAVPSLLVTTDAVKPDPTEPIEGMLPIDGVSGATCAPAVDMRLTVSAAAKTAMMTINRLVMLALPF